MSQKDLELLQKAGLLPIRAALLLGVSRQAFSEGLRREKDYLDAGRLRAISHALKAHEHRSAADIAMGEFLENLASEREHGGLPANGSTSAASEASFDYRLLFARTPAEIRNPENRDLTFRAEFSGARLFAYFVPDRQSAALLQRVIPRRLLLLGRQANAARLLIVESNLAAALPDMEIRRNCGGVWTGQIDSSSAGARLSNEYVARLLTILEAAGFGVAPSESPETFWPPTASELTFDGFRFLRVHDGDLPVEMGDFV